MSGSSIGNFGNFSGGSTYTLNNSNTKSILSSLTNFEEIDYGVDYSYTSPPSFVINDLGKIEVTIEKSGAIVVWDKIIQNKFIQTVIQKAAPTIAKVKDLDKLASAKGFGCKTVGGTWAVPIEYVSVIFLGFLKGDDIGTIFGNASKTFAQQDLKVIGGQFTNNLVGKFIINDKIDILKASLPGADILSNTGLKKYLNDIDRNILGKNKNINTKNINALNTNDLIHLLADNGGKGKQFFGVMATQATNLAVVNIVFNIVGNAVSGLIFGKDYDGNGAITWSERGHAALDNIVDKKGEAVYKGVVTSVFQVAGAIVYGNTGAQIGGSLGASIANWSAELFEGDDTSLLIAGCTTFAGMLAGLAVVALCALPGGVFVAAAVVIFAAAIGWAIGLWIHHGRSSP